MRRVLQKEKGTVVFMMGAGAIPVSLYKCFPRSTVSRLFQKETLWGCRHPQVFAQIHFDLIVQKGLYGVCSFHKCMPRSTVSRVLGKKGNRSLHDGFRGNRGIHLQVIAQIHRESIVSKGNLMGMPSPTSVCPGPL